MWLTPTMQGLLWQAALETAEMVLSAGAVAVIAGLPLALLLLTTSGQGIAPSGWVNRPLGLLVNAVRSVPFIILVVAIVPLTRAIAGTSIGTMAAVVPLAIAATAFIARLFETALREVDGGLVEAAQAMGASRLQIVGAGGSPRAGRGHHRHPGLAGRLLRDGRSGRRWRARRSRHPLRLPAFHAQCDGHRGGAADRGGAGTAIVGRMARPHIFA
jgi:ABC-type arginine transport system permease subunit